MHNSKINRTLLYLCAHNNCLQITEKGLIMANQENYPEATTLDEMVAHVCFCKLRSMCFDKDSMECMRNRNIYAEFMMKKSEERLL